MNEEFERKFRIKEFTLIEFEYWIVSLRPIQSTLGSLVISLKRDCRHMGNLNSEETKELAQVFKYTERLLLNLFQYDKINYLALMMIDEHVHYHVIPRYAETREFNNIKFMDENWSGFPSISTNMCDEETLIKLYH